MIHNIENERHPDIHLLVCVLAVPAAVHAGHFAEARMFWEGVNWWMKVPLMFALQATIPPFTGKVFLS